jgi:hypothetical protein
MCLHVSVFARCLFLRSSLPGLNADLLRLLGLSTPDDLLNCLLDPLAHLARPLFAHPSFICILDLLRHSGLALP